jgi:glyoxylase-like metal-dependent hydrolase (beta-lactamase superfamily II)/rhodanese-related sulfurtransferase
MKVEQIYTGCLAEAAYYIESEGEVAIIDPLREARPYLDKANSDKAKIKYVLETHFHADFVSGHLELAKKTGAEIVFGPTAAPAYPAHVASDGEILTLGKITIVVLHTPGHTMESSTYLLRDETGKDCAIFTGDTLFIGDVGRPDLVQKLKPEVTPELLAAHLFDSLRNKIMVLADDVIVYPGHGAGSACGKKLDKETVSTLGQQKKYNYALRADMTKEEFIRELLNGLVEPPQYFPANVLMNVKGYGSVEEVIRKGIRPLSLVEFETVWESSNALVIDTRSKDVFAKGFIPGSIFIGIDDTFAPWVGTLVTDLMQPILIIADEGKEEEVVVRLARVGYDNPLGYLRGGINAWLAAGNSLETILEITAQDFARLFEGRSHVNLLDVRRESEFKAEHLVGAENFPLDFINRNMSRLDKTKTYYIHCAGGYRSLIAASILKSRGYDKLVNLKGGYKALTSTALKRTEHQEVNTEL